MVYALGGRENIAYGSQRLAKAEQLPAPDATRRSANIRWGKGRRLSWSPEGTSGYGMRNPWLAVDVSTSHAARARELRRAWERFLEEAPEDAPVRDRIVESWRRSLAAGVPDRSFAPVGLDEQDVRTVWEEHGLAPLAPLLRKALGDIAQDADHLLVITDAEGMLLYVEGSPRTRSQAADDVNFVAGALWNEEAIGTNAIGTALAADHAIQVFAAEHFTERAHWWTCSAAPIHDASSGAIIGAVDLTTRMENVHPEALAAVTAAAMVVEAHLRERQHDIDRRLLERVGALSHRARDQAAVIGGDGRVLIGEPRLWDAPGAALVSGAAQLVRSDGVELEAEPLGHDEAYLLFTRERRRQLPAPTGLSLTLLGRDRALVRLPGGELTLSGRHSEIAALLAAHPSGLTAEALAIALYGDFGKPTTVRGEMSRLKRLLGSALGAEPYRFTVPVRSDLAAVQQLLEEGRTADAVSHYPGPMLPRSDAPGIVELRTELEGWMRRSVMTADDVEPLWSWLHTPSGEDDVAAWRRFLGAVPYEDGRRGQAATRLEHLREVFATAV
jgi:GAF domain-containing protein